MIPPGIVPPPWWPMWANGVAGAVVITIVWAYAFTITRRRRN